MIVGFGVSLIVSFSCLPAQSGAADASEVRRFPEREVDWAGETPSSLTINVDREGIVSLAVFNKRGVLVRELFRGARLKDGKHAIRWDGVRRGGEARCSGTFSNKSPTVRLTEKGTFCSPKILRFAALSKSIWKTALLRL